MKIGILAYHSACNYGANLQVLSTIGYLKRIGHSPIVINYASEAFTTAYKQLIPNDVYNAFADFRNQYMPMTSPCTSPQEIAMVIQEENIEAVIIGSDAVAQHHTLWERFTFPTRTILSVNHMTPDRIFPNPFWATFLDYMRPPIPVALMSASSQDSNYHLFLPSTQKQMLKRLQQFSYISARDEWTKNLYKYVSKGKLNVPVTPDPVFAFNYNCGDMLPSKDDILSKYHIPKNYILLSFMHSRSISVEWAKRFEAISSANGIACVSLPFPQCSTFTPSLTYSISTPLLPLDWYALIKYSMGYIGHNMHPIVTSIHNANPFFSFDNFGIKKLNGLYTSDLSSKIKHILSMADLSEYRVSSISRFATPPTPEYVFDKLTHFPHDKAKLCANTLYQQYETMMEQIVSSFTS